MKNLRNRRRGVVLLIVVSLLALFILLGVTYSLSVSQYHTGSKHDLKVQQVGDKPETEADLVFGQLMYDVFSNATPQYHSSLQGWSFLADLYGIDGIAGVVTGTPSSEVPQYAAGSGQTGQFLVFQATPDTQPNQPYNQTITAWSPVPEYYVGRVLTFVSGKLTGKSVRITRYVPASGSNPTFCVEMPRYDAAPNIYLAAGDQFLVNGAPFNGTGYGYQSAGGGSFNLNQVAPGTYPALGAGAAYTALLPHFAGYPTGAGNPMFNAAGGGMDESYDAADFQNLSISVVPPGRATDTTGTLPLIPSFHRPELVAYWKSKLDPGKLDTYGQPNFADAGVKALFRQFLFRPMHWDHRYFTGGNPALAYCDPSTAYGNTNAFKLLSSTTGVVQLDTDNDGTPDRNFFTWDVDNDGDGIPDSIWIDPGLPIITMPDGRRVKRLAAILVKDLDGRINVNVHGNSQQWAQTTVGGTPYETHRANYAVPYAAFLAGQTGGGTPPNVYLPRGLGFGPAEVDFQHIFGTTGLTAYQNLINERYKRGPYDIVAGVVGDDAYGKFRHLGLPGAHATQFGTIWNSPPDPWGRAVVGLDPFGQPLWGFTGDLGAAFNEKDASGNVIKDASGTNIVKDDITEDPYEVQYDHTRAWADSPYQPRELERLLRYHDPDAQSIDSRLLYNGITQRLLGSTTTPDRPGEISTNTLSHARREMLSTIGSYIPAPPGILAKESRNSGVVVTSSSAMASPGYNTILDLYARRLGSVTNFTQQWYTIVPFELLRGELFNINRPFGNGADDPSGGGNGLADDPNERAMNEQIAYLNTTPNVTIEKTNDGTLGLTNDPRLIYARHLYCLMMLLKDNSTTPWNTPQGVDTNGNPVTPGTPNDTARLIAQWAVNVVDFRDSDTIMTRFDYDPTPFDTDGWNPTGTTFVWGVERPELLITETLAFHDRRTEDLGNEKVDPTEGGAQTQPGKTTDTMISQQDTSFDQRLRPQGSCFIELYNPWYDGTANNTNSFNGYQHVPPELYSTITGGGNTITGVQLDKMVGGYPVWRLLIVKGVTHSNIATPPAGSGGPGQQTIYNPDARRPNDSLIINPTDIDRAVFFANPTNVTDLGAATKFYSSLGGNNLSLLVPGQYAVVGSSGYPAGGAYTTYVGRRQPDTTTPGNDTDFWMGPGKDLTRQIVLRPGQQRSSGNTSQPEVQILNNKSTSGMGVLPEIPVLSRAPIAVPIDSPRSFSITEPVGGYSAVDGNGDPLSTPPGGSVAEVYAVPLDIPEDISRPTDIPVSGDGTFANVRTVLLQRLADPTRGWDTNINPYITVDRSSIDVTSFNGLTNLQDPNPNAPPTQSRNFQTFQRGGSDPTADSTGWDGTPANLSQDVYRKLWPFTPPRTSGAAVPASNAESTVGPHNFARQLYHTLGYLNVRYGWPITTTTPGASPAYYGAPNPGVSVGTGSAMYMAFPWLTFNNRPFTSPMELLLVPATNQYGMLAQYKLRGAAGGGGPNDEYDVTNGFGAPFSHLLNFFQSSSTGGTAPQFCRLFDFVNVPSPYIQADLYYNWNTFNSTAAPFVTPATPWTTAAFSYRPPFHRVSRFREPGRLNINTIFDDSTVTGNGILQALFKSNPSMDPANVDQRGNGVNLVNSLRLSRQGSAAPLNTLPTTNPPPSLYYSPFRAQDASDLIPGGVGAPPVTAGWLRPQAAAPVATPLQPPLFAYDSTGTGATGGYDYEDTDRNPYFRYQRYQKIGNLLSTQSNCYAIWITIGYFEVEPNTGTPVIDPAHPEGLSLAQEAGSDSGEVTRHRAFYIIDRSIPVGFMPGSRLNSDDCVLVRRLIE